jgi:hypothetical protein
MTISANFPNVQPSLLLDFANAKQLPPQVTFTRATTAAYYDGSTTAMAEQNLLLQSQAFATASWTGFNSTVTANTTTAPDGNATASTITASATANPLVFQPKPFSTAGTVSIYLKKGTSNFGYLYVDNPTLIPCFFDLDTGVVGSFSAPFTSISIVSVGNGWYRCVASFSGVSGTNLGFGVCDADGSTVCTIGRTIFAWGSQIEQRSTATAYTVTTTQPVINYVPVLLTAGGGQPRFDHNPTTSESLGLEIEEQRANISLYSVYSSANWNRDFSSVTANNVVAPDGTLTAATLVEDTSSNFHLTYPPGISSGAAIYTASIYLKQAGRQYVAVQIYINGASSRYTVLFDLSNGSFVASNNVGSPTNTSYAITPVGNGWYRVSVTAEQTSSSTVGIAIGSSNSSLPPYASGFPTYTGNGWNAIYFWGAQVEAGTFATSYIPTTSAAATRAADSVSMTGTNFSSWYNAAEGTIYCEAKYSSASQLSTVYIGDGTTSNAIWVGKDVGGTNTPADAEMYVRALSANQGFPLISSTIGTVFAKLCGTYKTNDYAFSGNGAAVATDTNGIVPVVDRLLIGDYVYSTEKSQHIKKIAYYPIRVTNAQLQALTS